MTEPETTVAGGLSAAAARGALCGITAGGRVGSTAGAGWGTGSARTGGGCSAGGAAGAGAATAAGCGAGAGVDAGAAFSREDDQGRVMKSATAASTMIAMPTHANERDVGGSLSKIARVRCDG